MKKWERGQSLSLENRERELESAESLHRRGESKRLSRISQPFLTIDESSGLQRI
jgi:hypothetical protein